MRAKGGSLQWRAAPRNFPRQAQTPESLPEAEVGRDLPRQLAVSHRERD
jgi:hypothetical protein